MFSFKNIFTKLYFRGLKEVLGMRKQHLLQSNPSGGMTEGAGTVSSKEKFKKREKLKNDKIKTGIFHSGTCSATTGEEGEGEGKAERAGGEERRAAVEVEKEQVGPIHLQALFCFLICFFILYSFNKYPIMQASQMRGAKMLT